MKVVIILLTLMVLVWLFIIGIDKEEKRQCLIAQQRCSQYGVCSIGDLAVCNGGVE